MAKGWKQTEEAKEKNRLAHLGKIPWIKGKHHSPETRLKMSQVVKKAMSNPELRKRMSEVRKGKHPSKETRRISESNKGKIMPEEAKMKLSEYHKGVSISPKTQFKKGHTFSEETLKKISESQKKRLANPEARKRLSEANKGRPAWNKGRTGIFSEEARRNIGEASKKMWENPEFKKRMSEYRKGKLAGEKNPFYGKHQSEEARKKHSEFLKEYYKTHKHPLLGKEVPKERIEKQRRTLKEYYKTHTHPNLGKTGKTAWNKGLKGIVSLKGKEYSEKTLQKMREGLLKRYESGSFPLQENTKPERMIKEEMIRRGYVEGEDFIHQCKFMNKFMCDFVFPMQKIVLEVYGDFWHANPKIYPKGTPLHPHQLKGIGRDKSKKAYIQKVDNGSWTYLVLWESDIENNVAKCVDLIEHVFFNKRVKK